MRGWLSTTSIFLKIFSTQADDPLVIIAVSVPSYSVIDTITSREKCFALPLYEKLSMAVRLVGCVIYTVNILCTATSDLP